MAVEVTSPTLSSWLESSNTFSVSTWKYSGGCLRDAELGGVALVREHDRRLQRAVGARDPALDLERAADAREQVRQHRERLHVRAEERDREVAVGLQRHDLRHVEVAGREGQLGGRLLDGDRARRGRDDRVLEREVHDRPVRAGRPVDQRDLVVARVRAAGDADALALEEPVGDPVRAVAADDRVRRRVVANGAGEGADPLEDVDLHAGRASASRTACRRRRGRRSSTCRRRRARCRSR